MSDKAIFPVGATLDNGRFRISERLVGERWLGRYRALDQQGRRYVVTTGGKQKVASSDLMDTLAMNADGIQELVHIGGLTGDDADASSFTAMVESEPDGQPLAEVPLPCDQRQALAIARQLGRLLLRAHESDVVLGILPVELVYVQSRGRSASNDSELTVSSVVPRAPIFWRTATKPNFGLPQPFRYPMAAPEALFGHALEPAADSYVVALYVALLLTGTFPFTGHDYGMRAMHMQMGMDPAVDVSPPLDRLLELALDKQPSSRLPLRKLVDGLAAAPRSG